MAEFRTIALSDIIVPERLREVEEDHALAISASIVEHGLINPITVRRTPPATKPFRPYTLVTGAHRLRAIELVDEADIDAMVVEADRDEAQLQEIIENLFRNELSALDRAMFVVTYREVWERKHGKIKAGRNAVNITELIQEEARAGFSTHVAERLGLSVSAVEKAQRLGRELQPDLRRVLRGTPTADNQSQLLKLAAMEKDRQRLVAAAFAETPDIKRAIDLTDENAKPKSDKSQQEKLFDLMVSTWSRADEKTKARFLQHAKATTPKRERMPTNAELLASLDEFAAETGREE